MQILKFILASFLSMIIVITPALAFDPTGSRWDVTNLQKDTTKKNSFTISATNKAKTHLSTIVKSPTALQLAKRFGKGLNAAALALAVADIIGDGIDWTMDAESQKVKYQQTITTTDTFYCQTSSYSQDKCFSTVSALLKKLNPKIETFRLLKETSFDSYSQQCQSKISNDEKNFLCRAFKKVLTTDKIQKKSTTDILEFNFYIVNPESDAVVERELDLQRVAKKALEKELLTDTQIKTIVEDLAKSGAYDAELEKAQQEITQDNTCPKGQSYNTKLGKCVAVSDDTTNPDTTKPEAQKVDLPAFCTWASPVCDFMQYTKDKYEEFTKKDDSDTQVDLPEPEIPNINTDFQFSGQCPSDVYIDWRLPFGIEKNFKFYSYQDFCDLLENKIRYVVILLFTFFSVKIYKN